MQYKAFYRTHFAELDVEYQVVLSWPNLREGGGIPYYLIWSSYPNYQVYADFHWFHSLALGEAVGTGSVGVDFALELDAALLRFPMQEQSILPI